MEDKILDVRNLTVSFRTAGGKVAAVRDISFSLSKGETLAIVGESGSGKSVTSRSILGILAPNAVVERGEIIFDGKDLLKTSEEDFHLLRGEKLSMIFQDPLSSLDPIVKVGKQLTEAMLIKGRAKSRAARRNFNAKLRLLNRCMDFADGEAPEAKKANAKRCAVFHAFEYRHIQLENAYHAAKEAAAEALAEIDNALFEIDKNVLKDPSSLAKGIAGLARAAVNPYVVREDAERLATACEKLRERAKEPGDFRPLAAPLSEIRDVLTVADEKPMPNFFAMGYYLTFRPEAPAGRAKPDSRRELLPEYDVSALNRFLRQYLDEHFMLDFIGAAEKAVRYSAGRAQAAKRVALAALRESLQFFSRPEFDKRQARASAKGLIAAVQSSIDPLEIRKDDAAYTFRSALSDALRAYFDAKRQSARAEKRAERYRRQERTTGRNGNTEREAAAVPDLDAEGERICLVIERLAENYERALERFQSRDFGAEAVAIIDYFKASASAVVSGVSKRLAKSRALKLMEEVGIPEPRKRYGQYPFEFSGGMRQRIVIAIALAANPDLLICDEPTTALDVTIQAQILELINRLKRERKLTVIFITHDLGVVANMADRVAVMYAGKIVECGTTEEVFYEPAHPYTWALLSSMPDLDTKEKLAAIPGTPPNMIVPPKGDAFAARNPFAMKIDFEEQPPLFRITDTHSAATWLLHADAPKVEPPKIVTERIARMREKASGGKPV